ncbi:hypothetical protein [Pelosinus sp. IPA-1]|nr:hypothetical protein [Pelosinus sp. IPA-1]GMB02001.1 hypothetical protein PIPA1_48010 [Pelosinus sp. IPA-1]
MRNIKDELHQWVDSLSDYDAVKVQQFITPFVPEFHYEPKDEMEYDKQE